MLTGAIGTTCFNAEVHISAATQLDAGPLVDTPASSGHTIVSLAEKTVILEIKEGFALTPELPVPMPADTGTGQCLSFRRCR